MSNLSKYICHTVRFVNFSILIGMLNFVMQVICCKIWHITWHFKVKLRKAIIYCITLYSFLWGNLWSWSPDRLLQSRPCDAVNGNQTLLVHLPPLTPCNTLWRCVCVCVCVHTRSHPFVPAGELWSGESTYFLTFCRVCRLPASLQQG